MATKYPIPTAEEEALVPVTSPPEAVAGAMAAGPSFMRLIGALSQTAPYATPHPGPPIATPMLDAIKNAWKQLPEVMATDPRVTFNPVWRYDALNRFMDERWPYPPKESP